MKLKRSKANFSENGKLQIIEEKHQFYATGDHFPFIPCDMEHRSRKELMLSKDANGILEIEYTVKTRNLAKRIKNNIGYTDEDQSKFDDEEYTGDYAFHTVHEKNVKIKSIDFYDRTWRLTIGCLVFVIDCFVDGVSSVNKIRNFLKF